MEIVNPPSAKDDPEVENWDDGDFDNFDDIHFRSASTATSVVSHPQTNYRESASSRLSLRSDSNQGDEHWDVLVDEQSPLKDAVTIARSKGIPLPSNLPRSALEGGTIRRLGGKAVKKAIADDWSEDLDFASAPSQLRLAKTEDRDLSESLRQISAAFRSSPKSPDEQAFADTLKSPKARLAAATPVSLENFRDVDDDDEGFGDVPTIRVAKHRSPQKSQPTPSLPPKPKSGGGDIEEDLEIPSDGKLRLLIRKVSPRTPLVVDDFDMEWAEGSLGTRTAGIRRGGMSNRSSSISAMSPSVSSTFTGENDEDGLDGLVLPQGPVNFKDILKKKQESEADSYVPKSASSPQLSRKGQLPEEDWGEDLVIPNGKVFDGARLTLHRNIKQKTQRATSPGKIKATTLNFTTTTKSTTSVSRPRFGLGHERQERVRSHLEPVSETGAPIQRYQRPNSRLGHAASSSVSSIPAPATPTPSTPSRRDLRNHGSRGDMRYQPATTTNSQLLRAKRSMPVISGVSSPTRLAFNRPPSRQDASGTRMRPRSPQDRPDSRIGLTQKGGAPFLPAGVSTAQSQHVSIKSGSARGSRRADSDGSGENMSAAQRSLSRLYGMRPQTPGKGRSELTPAELAAQAKKTMNKPLRRRNWGDGSELEIFDDLPTSAAAEAQYEKQPIGRGAPRNIRSKIGQHGQAAASSTSLVSARSGAETPVPSTPLSPPKQSEPALNLTTSKMPRFARDTAASRNAREQRTVSTTFHNIRGEPLQPVSTNIRATITSKPTYGSLRRKRSVQQKPHLIKPLGGDHNRAKEEKGMYYNPVLSRWEGNDTALVPFDVPDFLPHQASPGETHHPNVKTNATGVMSSPIANSKPNMALIMNVGGSSGVQLVNGMVFDPRQMKWLKVARGERGDSISRGTGSVQLEEEEDVFAGLEDLKEESENLSSVHDGPRDRSVSGTAPNPFAVDAAGIGGGDDDDAIHNSGQSGDEWGVAEEFDVGPDFVRRQRSEEERWKRKVEKWLRSEEEVAREEIEGPGGWRYAIRELVSAGRHDTGLDSL